ncbi:MAG: ATP-dependent 6-phosphofructokinase, partial [Hyphomonadaceae bacterium]|nr:ATP-dependent 6-phosphofructokinase [Clostridia bacterium]
IFGIDGLVVIGGDGSFRGAQDLCRLGVPAVGIPGTIDNDITCTEYAIGFDTALETVKDAIDKLRDTATSHERCSVIEVMGRHAGHIALHAGIATGAEAIIIPEMPYDFNKDVLKPIIEGRQRGKHHNIVIVAEGVGGAVEMAEKIESITGVETRATILGHIQRGGSPSVTDRVVASQMGVHAVKLLQKGIGNRVVAMQRNIIVDFDIEEALQMKKEVSPELLETAKIISI